MADGFFNLPPDWRKYWKSMPSYNQEDLTPHQSIKVHFATPSDRELFAKLIDRQLTPKTRSIWYPHEEIGVTANKRYHSDSPVNPRYPVYIISKGRWESRLTSRALEKINVPYHIVVEPQEYENYAAVIDPEKILTLPFSNLGQGSIPARNFVWEHSVEQGAKRHWILDDNIRNFWRLNANFKIRLSCGNAFAAAENFVDRYENIAISGFNYYMFASRKTVMPPAYLNTRVYSCILIQNDIPYRWRGRYNEDTDLSIRALQDGWATILFNAFLAEKMPTMTMKGGNTESLYEEPEDGRRDMAQSLKDQHPKIVTITRKWGRWQHHVDYSGFAKNKMIPVKDLDLIPPDDNDFGMYLKITDETKLTIIDQVQGSISKIGKRFAGMGGVSKEQYERFTDRRHILDSGGKLAESTAKEMADGLADERILLVGDNIAEAFGCGDMEPLQWQFVDSLEADVAVIPAPVKSDPWWTEENKKAATEFLKTEFERYTQ